MQSNDDTRSGRVRYGALPLAFSLSALVAISATVTIPSAAAQTDTIRDFRPRRVLEAQPAITNPTVVTADRVRGQVTDAELVLGVEVNGEARAYPINMLTGPRREIINDTLGRVPIAATW